MLLLPPQILVPKFQPIQVQIVLSVFRAIRSLELVVMLVQLPVLTPVNLQLSDQTLKLVVHPVLPQDTFSLKLPQLPSVLVLNVQPDVVDVHQLLQLVVPDVSVAII